MSTTHKNIVLLTGGTGVFGKYLARELLRHNAHLIMLVRGENDIEAKKRVQDLIDLGNDIEVYAADLTHDNLGLSDSDYTDLQNRVTHVLHSAASARFTLPVEEARLYNVKTTAQILTFAEHTKNLVRFGFVSTALTAGKRSGEIMEDEFEHTEGFKNTYEETKYEAEALVRSYEDRIPLTILRPPLILPSKNDDFTIKRSINALYLGIKLVIDGSLSFLPGTKESTIDVVDSDIASRIIVDLMLKSELSHLVYHITNGKHAPTIEEILAIIEEKISHPAHVDFYPSMYEYNKRVTKIPWYKVKPKQVHKRIASFISELAYPKTFNNKNTLEELNIKDLGHDPLITVTNVLSEDVWKSLA